jgi:hypothetical protein
MVVNKYLVDDLMKLNLWTADIRTQIIANNGSILRELRRFQRGNSRTLQDSMGDSAKDVD